MAIMGGLVGIGTVAPMQTLSVNGSAGKTGGGTWVTFSDRRLKKDIAPYQESIDILSQVSPVTYRYNGKGGISDDSTQFVGVIAQELREIAPHMIDTVQMTGTDSVMTDYLSVDHNAFTFMLINATKAQQQEIETLKSELTQAKQNDEQVKGEMTEMSERIERLEALLGERAER